MNALLPAGLPGACSFSGFAPQDFFGARSLLPRRTSGAASQNRVRRLNIAVKKSGELRLGQSADAGRLDVAVLEEHQRGDASNAKFGRRVLVLVDVDLRDLQTPLVFLRYFVEDRRDRLARATPFGPVIDQDRSLGIQDLGLERVVQDLPHLVTTHGSPLGI